MLKQIETVPCMAMPFESLKSVSVTQGMQQGRAQIARELTSTPSSSVRLAGDRGFPVRGLLTRLLSALNSLDCLSVTSAV